MTKKTAKIIDGKTLSQSLLLRLKAEIVKLKRQPGLAVVLIGDDPASKLYVNNKKKAALKTGIAFHNYLCGGEFCPNTTQKEIIEMIDFLNKDKAVDGIIVQLQIPKKFNTKEIIERIDPKKDVDGFHPKNSKIKSPLIQAIDAALKFTNENLEGKAAVIISKNPIFAEPLGKELKNQGIKIEIIKPDDKNLISKTKTADILIAVVGRKHFVKKDMIKPGAILIDVGTNLIGDKKWAGDIDPKAYENAGWFTPVPGGIGPLTVAFLLKNTYDIAKNNQ